MLVARNTLGLLPSFIVTMAILRKKYKRLRTWKTVKIRLLYILMIKQFIILVEGHIIIVAVPPPPAAAVALPKYAALGVVSPIVANAAVLVVRIK